MGPRSSYDQDIAPDSPTAMDSSFLRTNGGDDRPSSIMTASSSSSSSSSTSTSSLKEVSSTKGADDIARIANSSNNGDDDDIRHAPLPLRPWIAWYRSVPTCHIPGTPISVTFTLVSCLALSAARLVAEYVLPHHFGWPPASHKITEEAAACAVSGMQAFCLLCGLASCLFSQPYRPAGLMSDHPGWWRDGANSLLEFCTGYMIYDALFLVGKAWIKGENIPDGDIMYIGHHFATSYMMTGVRLMGAGHLSAMYLMFTGEMTSPLMNSHFILRLAVRLRCCSGPVTHALLACVEYVYAILYCICRIVLGPVGAAHLSYHLLLTKEGRRNVNVVAALSWMPMVWGVLLGSRPWIEEAIEMLSDGLEVKYGPDYDLGKAYRHDEL